MNNSLGEYFRITSFGESHGRCIGVVIDGCPAGLDLTSEDIQSEVDKRKPASGVGQTTRAEEDKVEVLSGVFNGFTTGAPIGLLVWNKDTDSSEYEKTRLTPRPGHADYTAYIKYEGFNDYRGGGRFSGRVTVGAVMAGALAKKILKIVGIDVLARTIQIGTIKVKISDSDNIRKDIYSNPLRCADKTSLQAMTKLIEDTAKEGDSLGGIVQCIAYNVPAGLGEPIYSSLEGEISKALFSIPAVKGVEFGSGFEGSERKGSQNNDAFVIQNGRVLTESSNAGGILGGISTGMPIVATVAIKPTPSISRMQRTVNLQTMSNTELTVRGRHDVCLVPRAVIVVESMMAITLCEFVLRAGLLKRIVK
jgi:chorismate synthase